MLFVHSYLLNYEIIDDSLFLSIQYDVKPHECPNCGYVTSLIHDYRIHTIIGVPFQNLKVIFKYRKKRYKCPVCNKKFDEKQQLAPKHCQYSSRMNYFLYDKLKFKQSIADIARQYHTSPNKLFRLLNQMYVNSMPKLPKVLSIDEFKGNAGRKFQCIIADPVNKRIVDILPGREGHILSSYFSQFSREERMKVRFFVMDMNREYLSIAKAFFPNAIIIIDRFHYARYNNWSLENIRRKAQKRLLPEQRKYFKRSKKLLNMRFKKLNNDAIDTVSTMILIAPELQEGYFLKEKFYEFLDAPTCEDATKNLNEFLFHSQTLDVPEYKPTSTMLINWKQYILNSFAYRYSNAFIEGINNKIKVLKRVAFGFRNFDNIRKRILLLN